MIPYGRQDVSEEDIQAVVDVLRSDWLTQGPMVGRFETAVADYCGAAHGIAVNSGTAALHGLMHALGIGPGDEVIVPPITFVATANCVVFQGATPVFADVDPDTLLLDPVDVEAKIRPSTRAIIAVDYAGQPCDYQALGSIARRHGIALVADACHSLGARFQGRPVGGLADATVFSFHPVKPITCGEGGLVVTSDAGLAGSMERFRSHGIDRQARQREKDGAWYYEMVELGYNYRLTDIQAALGLSQFQRLDGWIRRRQAIAGRYAAAIAGMDGLNPLGRQEGADHGYHLYVVRVEGDRERWFQALRRMGIGVNVHYVPVHLHPFYRKRFGTGPGMCPVAEAAYERILSLPIFPAMSDEDVDCVIRAVAKSVE